MRIELNQTTFRRLVKLYLLATGLTLGAVVLESFVWSDFGAEFDTLVTRHFGEPSDAVFFLFGGGGLLAFAVHIVAAVRLLDFRRWARTTFWVTMLPILLMGALPSLGTTWSGSLSLVMDVFASGLFGAILLLAYAREHGAAWFHKPTLEEIF